MSHQGLRGGPWHGLVNNPFLRMSYKDTRLQGEYPLLSQMCPHSALALTIDMSYP